MTHGRLRSTSTGMMAALALLASVAPAAAIDWNGTWFESHTGGSTVELPSFLEAQRDFTENGVSLGTEYQARGDAYFYLQQFVRPTEPLRPFEFINARYGAPIATITYSVDRDDLGVISGYRDREQQQPFYDVCRRAQKALMCLSIGWEPTEQKLLERIIDRIFQSLTPDPQWSLMLTP